MIKLNLLFSRSIFNLAIRFICLPGLILIQSCASPPQPRPKAVTNAEYFLQQGTAAFYNDEYPVAANNFTQALKIYQSIDSNNGMLESQINLMETSLAIGSLTLARQQLQVIETMLSGDSSETYRLRIILLNVKLLFNEEHYAQAIKVLKPVLPTFNAQHQVQDANRNTLNILSSMARLTVLSRHDDAILWLTRLQLAIDKNKQDNNRYRALLLRIHALQKQHEGELHESKILLNEALSMYRAQVYRRGIAACLQLLANLEIQQQNWHQADAFLLRALKIHLWTLNQRETRKVLNLLVETNNEMEKFDVAQRYSDQLLKLK